MDHTELKRRAQGADVAQPKGPVLNITMRQSSAPELNAAGAASSVATGVAKPTTAAVPVAMNKWVPDDRITLCSAPECRQPFTLLKRKHHCRTCGNIFCNNCWAKYITGEDATSHRVCNACYYEHQLAISVHRPAGSLKPRRRARGELKLLTRRVLVLMVSFLDVPAIGRVARASSDFYFACRDNALWELKFLHRFPSASSSVIRRTLVGGATAVPPPGGVAHAQSAPDLLQGHRRTQSSSQTTVPPASFAGMGQRANSSMLLAPPNSSVAAAGNVSPVPQTQPQIQPLAGELTSLGGAAAVHNYSVFPVFVRHMAADRCDGIATYAARVRQLFTIGPRIAVIGPHRIGKTQLIRRFLGEPASANPLTTVGMCAYDKRVAVTGSVSTTTNVVLYEVCGEERFGSLRALCAEHSHAVVVCYDPDDPASLKAAAAQAAALPPRPVIACGIHKPGNAVGFGGGSGTRSKAAAAAPSGAAGPRVTQKDAERMSVHCVASVQVTLGHGADVIESAVQAVVEDLFDRGARTLPHPTVLDVLFNQA
jgi:hypothetical protein